MIAFAGRPYEHVDEVRAVLVDERGHRARVKVVDAPTDQLEPLRLKVGDRRREIYLAFEPRFDGVAVARGDVGKMVNLGRADVRGDHLAEQEVVFGSLEYAWRERQREDRGNRGGSSGNPPHIPA